MSWKRFKRLAHRHVPHCRKLHPYAGSTARMELCGCVKNAFLGARCCTRDEGGPFGAGLQEQISNARKLLLFNDGDGERYGKGMRRSRQV